MHTLYYIQKQTDGLFPRQENGSKYFIADNKVTIENEDDFLVNQACIKDPSKTVENMISDAVGKMGENIRITRFIRFAIGE